MFWELKSQSSVKVLCFRLCRISRFEFWFRCIFVFELFGSSKVWKEVKLPQRFYDERRLSPVQPSVLRVELYTAPQGKQLKGSDILSSGGKMNSAREENVSSVVGTVFGSFGHKFGKLVTAFGNLMQGFYRVGNVTLRRNSC